MNKENKELTIIVVLTLVIAFVLWLIWNPQVLRDVVSFVKYPQKERRK